MKTLKDSTESSIVLIHHRQQNVIAGIVNSGIRKMVHATSPILHLDIIWLINGFDILLSLSQVKSINSGKSRLGKILKKGLGRNE